jgi:hypothetical protein
MTSKIALVARLVAVRKIILIRVSIKKRREKKH